MLYSSCVLNTTHPLCCPFEVFCARQGASSVEVYSGSYNIEQDEGHLSRASGRHLLTGSLYVDGT
jgi:hypothetical protein